ncbi:hypothetical protein [Jeotgalibaca sp. PTS2502]|uniref:hypothetical protein n=1 Tax=Jeotgalibaca sp. PTS2502 TaxID=1903686 RepID=UPI0018DD18F4
MNLDKLTTETRNPETLQLDQMSVADVLKHGIINHLYYYASSRCYFIQFSW